MTDSTKNKPAPSDEGVIEDAGRFLFGKNWKTNLAAAATFALGVVAPLVTAGLPKTPQEWLTLGLGVAGTLGFGVAKDFDKSHTQRGGKR